MGQNVSAFNIQMDSVTSMTFYTYSFIINFRKKVIVNSTAEHQQFVLLLLFVVLTPNALAAEEEQTYYPLHVLTKINLKVLDRSIKDVNEK